MPPDYLSSGTNRRIRARADLAGFLISFVPEPPPNIPVRTNTTFQQKKVIQPFAHNPTRHLLRANPRVVTTYHNDQADFKRISLASCVLWKQ
jgi:hypothetical protein